MHNFGDTVHYKKLPPTEKQYSSCYLIHKEANDNIWFDSRSISLIVPTQCQYLHARARVHGVLQLAAIQLRILVI